MAAINLSGIKFRTFQAGDDEEELPGPNEISDTPGAINLNRIRFRAFQDPDVPEEEGA